MKKLLLVILAALLLLLPLPALAANALDEVQTLLDPLITYFTNSADSWAAVSMAACGEKDAVAGQTLLEDARAAYATGNATDWERAAISLTALGVDATDVYGGTAGAYLDFVDKICDRAAPTAVNDAIYALIVLDSGDYSDAGYGLTRAGLIAYICDNSDASVPGPGQVAWTFGGSTVDLTAMAICALAPYYGSDASATTAVDGALAYLSAKQNSNGHYGNVNSTAMVVVALAALGIDAQTDSNFIKNGYSLLDGLLAFRLSSGLFSYNGGAVANNMGTEQAFRALAAYQGFLDAGSAAYNIYRFGPQTGDGTELTGVADPNSPGGSGTSRAATVRVEDLVNGQTLMSETNVTASGTLIDALQAALIANHKDPTTELSVSNYGYVDSLLGLGGGDTGWMCAVKGKSPAGSLVETEVNAGDALVMFLMNWNDSVYITKFDQSAANMTAGNTLTLTLTGIDSWSWMDGGTDYTAIAGATVYAYNSSGAQVASAVSGADGKATLTFATAGSYTVSAKRTGTHNATDLVPPLCKVTVSNPSPGGTGNDIKVSFTLLGDVSNPQPDTLYTYKNNASAFSTLIAKEQYSLSKGSSVKDLFEKALTTHGISYAFDGSGSYIKTINGLSEFTRGPLSGWMYIVNGAHPGDAVNVHTLKNGDNVIVHYTYDLNSEQGSEQWSGSPATLPAATVAQPEAQQQEAGQPIAYFSDVPAGHWAAAYIYALAARGVINGKTPTLFAPNDSLTRAELTALLCRLSGETALPAQSQFSDVADGVWYAGELNWAVEAGIIQGLGDGRFAPGQPVSRQDMVVMLKRYADYQGLDLSPQENLRVFSDGAAIAAYATEAVKDMQLAGIVGGYEDGSFRPTGPVSRAEAAKMLALTADRK